MEQTRLPTLSAPPASTIRHDGWTAERQRIFCEDLADYGSVMQAARAAGMSVRSAYSLRRRADGRAFAQAWDAALLLARQRLIDDAYQLAIDGSHDVITRHGEVVAERRHRDSRSILASLERLKQCDVFADPATRIIAQDFDAFLGMMDGAATPADTKAFLDARSGKRPTPQRGDRGQFLPRNIRS
jgi:hypothetical protein